MPHSSKEVIKHMDKNQLRQLLLRLVAHTHSNKKKSKKTILINTGVQKRFFPSKIQV